MSNFSLCPLRPFFFLHSVSVVVVIVISLFAGHFTHGWNGLGVRFFFPMYSFPIFA